MRESLEEIARAPSGHDAKLLNLQKLFEFSDAALLTGALAFRVETDPFFAHKIARFQEPLGRSHLLLGFLASALCLQNLRQGIETRGEIFVVG